MSKPPTKHPNFLSVDFGTARIGVARASAVARLAEPLVTIPGDHRAIQRIVELAEKEDAGTIVVGRPRGLDGQHTPQTQLAEDFAKDLASRGLKVELVDEALTSSAAKGFLKAKHRPGWTHEDVDNIAAMIILDDYLHSL